MLPLGALEDAVGRVWGLLCPPSLMFIPFLKKEWRRGLLDSLFWQEYQ